MLRTQSLTVFAYFSYKLFETREATDTMKSGLVTPAFKKKKGATLTPRLAEA